MTQVLKAKSNDAQRLTELTFRSKAYWNYSQEQLAVWKNDLTITPDYIVKNEVYILFENDQIYGYYSWINENETDVELDNIFVDPLFIGKGFWKLLMQDFLNRITDLGKQKIILYSDPQAENFYLKFGFKTVGELQSRVKDRFLPIMEKNLINRFDHLLEE